MRSGNQPHILNASSNLLGICFVIVTGLKLTGVSEKTWADEISLLSAVSFVCSCVLSYVSLRTEKYAARYEVAADYLFLTGLFALFVAVLAFARDIF